MTLASRLMGQPKKAKLNERILKQNSKHSLQVTKVTKPLRTLQRLGFALTG